MIAACINTKFLQPYESIKNLFKGEKKTETDHFDDNLFLSDLMAKKTKTPDITTPARGRASLPMVHFVPKNGMNKDTDMNDCAFIPNRCLFFGF
jgi:hypothetical protein